MIIADGSTSVLPEVAGPPLGRREVRPTVATTPPINSQVPRRNFDRSEATRSSTPTPADVAVAKALRGFDRAFWPVALSVSNKDQSSSPTEPLHVPR
jgi:hypothetical protein